LMSTLQPPISCRALLKSAATSVSLLMSPCNDRCAVGGRVAEGGGGCSQAGRGDLGRTGKTCRPFAAPCISWS
jgi:hypothetical protein